MIECSSALPVCLHYQVVWNLTVGLVAVATKCRRELANAVHLLELAGAAGNNWRQ